MKIVNLESIEGKLLTIRGEQVLLDSDVAEVYGVETKRINEADKNKGTAKSFYRKRLVHARNHPQRGAGHTNNLGN